LFSGDNVVIDCDHDDEEEKKKNATTKLKGMKRKIFMQKESL